MIYFDQQGPGILVNEFKAIEGKPGTGTTTDCGCGVQFHTGADYDVAPGTPVPAMAEGIVVKVEENELATVDTPTAGRCGRYVVIKHTFQNGRIAYSRYAQLGKVAMLDGKPIAIGQPIKDGVTVGEVGSAGRFHLEVRPVEPATMDQTPEWSRLYGAEPAMEWSRYQPVDPEKFDSATFGGKAAAETGKK